jgi:hypothetical protein
MSQRFKNHGKRIEQIFHGKFNDLSRRLETLIFYKSYVEANLNFPVRITGIEDFDWEEFYILGPGNKREYEMLKKTQPSYTDIFSMSRIDPYCNKDYVKLLIYHRRLSRRNETCIEGYNISDLFPFYLPPYIQGDAHR